MGSPQKCISFTLFDELNKYGEYKIMAHCCNSKGCELEVQYVCQCLPSGTYFCEFHLQAHLRLLNRSHFLDSILTEPSEFTKDAILKFLEKEKAKKEKLMTIALASYNKNWKNIKKSIKINLSDLNSDIKEINCLIEKISQVSEGGPLDSLPSGYDADKKAEILKNDLDEYAEIRLFYKSRQLRNKKSEILNRANNDPETEQYFRQTCSLYENYATNSLLSQAYQEFIKGYQKIASTYNSDYHSLYIYNTEIEKEEIKYFEYPEKFRYSYGPSIQLPNGELFVINSLINFILDRNYQIRNLPAGAPEECFSAIYFNRSIYCIGKRYIKKFDLDENRWRSGLVLMRKHINCYFNSVVFNRNILISIDYNSEILIYSIDIESFSEILYSFAKSKKILINIEEKLFIIECEGWIYESENEYDWKKIAKSIIEMNPERVHCCYNKGGIYISTLTDDKCRNYFKFDLNPKTLIGIAFYSNNFNLQRSGDKFETINYYDKTFEIILKHQVSYTDNWSTLHTICQKFKKLNKKIKSARKITDTAGYWRIKGNILCSLGMYLEAIEFYNKAINFSPYSTAAYNDKGCVLQNLGRHFEAIECYNEVIKWAPYYFLPYNNKGNSLQKLGKHLEAIECYNESIKLAPWHYNNYLNKGNAFMNLGRNLEAIECYNEAIKLKPDYAEAYNSKGEALYNLDKNIEAIECYNVAIKLKIDEPLFYHNRANTFNKAGRDIEALQDFNKADELIKNLQSKG